MAITLRKTIPSSSSYYTTGGDQSITLNGSYRLVINSKKEPIVIKIPKTKSRQISEPSDKFDVYVVDLKKGKDTFTISAQLEDDNTDTAWTKFWRLRAMNTTGGPLTSLVIDNLTFDVSSQQAFLEDITGIVVSDDTGELNVNKGNGIARIDVTMIFSIGQER